MSHAPRGGRLRRIVGLLVFSLVAGLGAAAAALASGPPEVPPAARARGIVHGGEPRVEARLLLDAMAVPAGEALHAGVLFDLAPGWHVYWKNPGETALPTRLEWTIEQGEAGPVEWPAPGVFRESDGTLLTYGYEDRVLLASEVRFSAAAAGERTVRVVVDFLACQVQCVPGRFELERQVRVDRAREPADAATRALFAEAARRRPVPFEAIGLAIEPTWSQSAIRPGDGIRGAIAVSSCASEHGCGAYRPATSDAPSVLALESVEGMDLRVTGIRSHPFSEGDFLVTIAGRVAADATSTGERLAGVLALRGPGRDRSHVEVALRLPSFAQAGTPVAKLEAPWLEPEAPAAAIPQVELWQVLLLALVGGAVLNLMPCVLPVLAIKVFALARLAHAPRREAIGHAAAYTAGILASLFALAAAVVLLRMGGRSVGWGFQFQEPVFLAVVSAVLVVFALNLFGAFDLWWTGGAIGRLGEQSTGLRRSFFEGLLAVVVATPCSAPFLGTAVGFAFASPAPVIFAVFAAIGLGLAAPYAAVTLVPGLARFVPLPGDWMVRLRQGLGFALLGTVVWLAWVYGRVAGANAMTALLAWLLFVAAGTWGFGVLRASGHPRAARGWAVALVLLGVSGLMGARRIFEAEVGGIGQPMEAAQGDVLAYSPEALRAELARGRPAFVVFTADWCLTCKWNERMVLRDPRVVTELERLDVAWLVADWTRRDESIRQELARFGRAGVPMYLVYGPDEPDAPRLLPDLISVDVVIDALRASAPRHHAAVRDGEAHPVRE